MKNPKPCKCRCGGEAQMMYNQSTPSFPYYVCCNRCGIRSNLFPTESEASESWNVVMGIQHCCYNCDCLEDQHYCLLHGLAVDLGMSCGDWEPEKDENNERL